METRTHDRFRDNARSRGRGRRRRRIRTESDHRRRRHATRGERGTAAQARHGRRAATRCRNEPNRDAVPDAGSSCEDESTGSSRTSCFKRRMKRSRSRRAFSRPAIQPGSLARSRAAKSMRSSCAVRFCASKATSETMRSERSCACRLGRASDETVGSASGSDVGEGASGPASVALAENGDDESDDSAADGSRGEDESSLPRAGTGSVGA